MLSGSIATDIIPEPSVNVHSPQIVNLEHIKIAWSTVLLEVRWWPQMRVWPESKYHQLNSSLRSNYISEKFVFVLLVKLSP